MNPIEFTDYREFLNTYCRQPESKRGIQAELARAAGCQASYFSQVLKGKVHLTEDQALGIAESMSLSPAETEHLLLLVRLAKAGTSKLKSFLEKRIERSRRENLNLSNRVPSTALDSTQQLGEYFASWLPSAVHLLTSSECNTTEKIARRLSVPEPKIIETIKLLKQLDFIRKEGITWKYKGAGMHLPKNSPWQMSMQSSRRQLAERSFVINAPDSVHFSSLFTIDKVDLEKLKKMVAELVEESHKKIESSGSEELACLCLDLFTVI